MAKKKDHAASPAAPAAPAQTPLLSKRGRVFVLAGLAVVVLGFVVLSFTDPMGQNMASRVSPFLIVGGYALIGIGLLP